MKINTGFLISHFAHYTKVLNAGLLLVVEYFHSSVKDLEYFLCNEDRKNTVFVCWGDICGQSYRSGRVNVNQLQHRNINLALLKEEGAPPALPPSPRDFHRSVVLSTCRRLWKHTGVYNQLEAVHNNSVRCINKALNPGLSLILRVTMVNHLSFWMTHNYSVCWQLKPGKDSPHLPWKSLWACHINRLFIIT